MCLNDSIAGENAGVGLRITPRATEGRTVQAAGCSRLKLAATRSIESENR